MSQDKNNNKNSDGLENSELSSEKNFNTAPEGNSNENSVNDLSEISEQNASTSLQNVVGETNDGQNFNGESTEQTLPSDFIEVSQAQVTNDEPKTVSDLTQVGYEHGEINNSELSSNQFNAQSNSENQINMNNHQGFSDYNQNDFQQGGFTQVDQAFQQSANFQDNNQNFQTSQPFNNQNNESGNGNVSKKKFYKNPVFWIILVISVFAAFALATMFGSNTDRDEDGLTRSEEVETYKTNPRKADSDSDGFTDSVEIELGTDPTVKAVSLSPGVWVVGEDIGAGTYNMMCISDESGEVTITDTEGEAEKVKLGDGFFADGTTVQVELEEGDVIEVEDKLSVVYLEIIE